MTIALGGVWDEAQIRGLSIAFRSPEADRIVKGLLDAGVCNPVFVLDEIDKVARRGSFGDPSAALLEVLDPQQNHAFHDCYADVGVDLSEVLFIATANRLETVPAALRDRMEVIEVPGYSAEEKLPIVRKHLLPRQIEASGLRAGRLWTGVPEAPCGEKPAAVAEAAPVEMTDTAIRALIRDHTCEAGVRQLERLVGAVCQHVAFRRVAAGEAAPVTVVADAREAERLGTKAQQYVTIEELFGAPRYGSLPDAVRETVSRKWERVFALHPADPEAAAARAWIEVVEDLPWGPAGDPAAAGGARSAAPARQRLCRARRGEGAGARPPGGPRVDTAGGALSGCRRGRRRAGRRRRGGHRDGAVFLGAARRRQDRVRRGGCDRPRPSVRARPARRRPGRRGGARGRQERPRGGPRTHRHRAAAERRTAGT